MNWMWIATGIFAAGAAIALLRVWSIAMRKESKKERSKVATVKRVAYLNQNTVLGIFLVDGQEIQLSVPEMIARQLREGECGVLTYRGTEFVYFVPRQQQVEVEEDFQWKEAC